MTGPQSIDPQRVQDFASRMLDIYSGGMLSYLVDIGHRTGLFEAAARGPATSAGLAPISTFNGSRLPNGEAEERT